MTEEEIEQIEKCLDSKSYLNPFKAKEYITKLIEATRRQELEIQKYRKGIRRIMMFEHGYVLGLLEKLLGEK